MPLGGVENAAQRQRTQFCVTMLGGAAVNRVSTELQSERGGGWQWDPEPIVIAPIRPVAVHNRVSTRVQDLMTASRGGTTYKAHSTHPSCTFSPVLATPSVRPKKQRVGQIYALC
jgi:hypothetical protein